MNTNNCTAQKQLDPALLKRLQQKRDLKEMTFIRDVEAMREAAKFFGIAVKHSRDFRGDWYNKTLTALDLYDPNWRGYPAPYDINAVVSHSQEAA